MIYIKYLIRQRILHTVPKIDFSKLHTWDEPLGMKKVGGVHRRVRIRGEAHHITLTDYIETKEIMEKEINPVDLKIGDSFELNGKSFKVKEKICDLESVIYELESVKEIYDLFSEERRKKLDELDMWHNYFLTRKLIEGSIRDKLSLWIKSKLKGVSVNE